MSEAYCVMHGAWSAPIPGSEVVGNGGSGLAGAQGLRQAGRNPSVPDLVGKKGHYSAGGGASPGANAAGCPVGLDAHDGDTLFLSIQQDLVIVVAHAALHSFEALVDGGFDQFNLAGATESESFPLPPRQPRGKLSVKRLAEGERILVRSDLITSHQLDEPKPPQPALGADKSAVKLQAVRPGMKMAWAAFARPLRGVLLDKFLEFLLNTSRVADNFGPHRPGIFKLSQTLSADLAFLAIEAVQVIFIFGRERKHGVHPPLDCYRFPNQFRMCFN